MGAINSGYGTAQAQNPGQSVPPFPVNSADNGLSVEGGFMVLGNTTAGILATLLNNREIPMAGFDIHFSGPAGSLTVSDSPLNATNAAGLFNNLPKLTLAGGKPTLNWNIVDDGTVGGSPWGTASQVFRTSNASAPVIADITRFGPNVTLAINDHYGKLTPADLAVNAYEIWQGQNTGVDVIPFSLYGQGKHFAGTYAAPTVRVSNALHIGWNDQIFPQATYALGTPQLSIRAGLTTQRNTYLELSNPGSSPAALENIIGFSVDNAPVVIASNFPSSKSVFALKSNTGAATGTQISMYLGTTNILKGTNLVGQETLKLLSEFFSQYLPTVQVTYRLSVGAFLTNDGYDVAKQSSFIVDAFNLPFYWRNMVQLPNPSLNIITIDPATQQVKMCPFGAPAMTTVAKLALAAVSGMIVYDITLNKLCIFTTVWETITSI